MKSVNIIYVNNGVGLTRDANLLRELLVRYGYYVNLVEFNKVSQAKTADVAIHLEICQQNAFRLGRKNVYIPNPEWYQENWDRFLHQYTVVCSKTLDCERIFGQKHRNTIYTGFTSIDRFLPDVEKIHCYLHTGGQSETKGTDKIFRAWLPAFKRLLITTKKHNFRSSSNILFMGWLSDVDHQYSQNRCLIHICPSIYEGFGHIINEAMSCGAVIVTTDAPPMNECITGNGFLIPVSSTGRMALAKTSHVNHVDIADIIKKIETTDINTLKSMGDVSRKLYLHDKENFEHRFIQILSEL
jgi:hypothetical protein